MFKKRLSLLEVTRAKLIQTINNTDETIETIAVAIGSNASTVGRIKRSETGKPDVTTVQNLYEYLFDCELQF